MYTDIVNHGTDLLNHGTDLLRAPIEYKVLISKS